MNILTKILPIALFLVAFAGCRSAPIYNVENLRFGSEARSTEGVGDTILLTGQSLEWEMREVGKHKIRGIRSLRSKHKAEVLITYDSETFSIEYADSENLNYEEENKEIHKVYNIWVRELERTIHRDLLTPPVTETWYGEDVDELIANWGPPSRTTALKDGTRLLEYIHHGSAIGTSTKTGRGRVLGFGGGGGAFVGGIRYKSQVDWRSDQSICRVLFRTGNDGDIASSRFGGGHLACKELLNGKPRGPRKGP